MFSLILFVRIFTLFSKSLPLDTACRVWDLFCRDGEEFLFRTALGKIIIRYNVKLFFDIISIFLKSSLGLIDNISKL